MSLKKKVVFISWAPYCSRSDNIARELGGDSYMVYYGFLGSNYFTILLKYFLQAIKTFQILLKERPDVVFCMTPPIFTSIPAWLYTKLFKGTGFVLDYHTAAFVMKIYQKLSFIQKFFARRAIVNILTNDSLAEIVDGWGGRTTLIGDVKVRYHSIKKYDGFKEGFNIVFVGRYSPTEPLDVLFAAAEKLKDEDVNFYVTGSLKDADRKVIEECPNNVHLTDFLEDSIYAGLLRDTDAVMSLCTNDNTMQRGAYEAMSRETPLIISDWNLLRQTFDSGTVYVKNDVDGIVAGVLELRSNYDQYQAGIKKLKRKRNEIWETKILNLHGIIGQRVGGYKI